MYTLRNAGSLDQQLKIVHDAGVRAVETVGTQNVSAQALKQLLDRYAIKAVSSHVPLTELRNNLDGVVAFNRAIGNTTLVVPYLDQKDRPADAAGWTALGQDLGRIARQLRGRGCSLPITTTTSSWPTSKAGPGWSCCSQRPGPSCNRAGPGLGRACGSGPGGHAGQVQRPPVRVHAKDNAPKGQAEDEGGFAAVGQGVLDWNAILPAAAAANVKWYIVEHDQPRDPGKVIQTGADYLREHLTLSQPARARR